MLPEFYSLDLSFPLDNRIFHILRISRGTIEQVPMHSHGADNYEIHYLPFGYGTAVIDDKQYPIIPNTLYVTGPFVKHSQHSSQNSSLFEYCINLKVDPALGNSCSPSLSSRFLAQTIWYGQDSQDLFSLLQQIFQELEKKSLGYIPQIQSLFVQCIIALLRNYDDSPLAASLPCNTNGISTPHSGCDKTLMAENYFLFEYSHLSLEELAHILGFSIRQTQRFLFKFLRKNIS